MQEIQKYLLTQVETDFDTLWNKFCDIIPPIVNLVSPKEQNIIRIKYVKKLKALFDSQREIITSTCLFDELITYHYNGKAGKDFKELVNGIADTVKLALNYALSNLNTSIPDKIKHIIKEMLITMDENPSSNNSDYKNRLHELLVFNMFNECENINITDIEYPLSNKKSCDFRCVDMDGKELLVEVLSIHNIDLSKQDNGKTFSDFINSKVQKKYDDKLKGIVQIKNFKILPIIEFVDDLFDFVPTLDSKISLPICEVAKILINDKNKIWLISIEKRNKCNHFLNYNLYSNCLDNWILNIQS